MTETTVRVAEGPALVLAGYEGEPLTSLAAYRAVGGYEQLEKARAQDPQAVIQEIIESNLRGRGGAFFPTGRKASFIPTPDKIAKPIYITVNADESEPGTFKDREIMLKVPHRLIEGCLVAAHAIQSKHVYIYIRGEYAEEYRVLQAALDEARDAGLLAGVEIVMHRGAGAYICGEETALLESLEGKRGQPRSKPPFPAISGVYAAPTLINNVESITTIPPVLAVGPAEFAQIGAPPDSTGTRLFCLSGNVARPGLYEVELGTSLRVLLELADAAPAKAVLLGGAAGSFLRPDQLDLTLSFEAAREAGVTLGSGVVIVFGEQADLVAALLRIAEFFRDESCGQCVPCRVGTVRQEEALHRLASGKASGDERAILADLTQVMRDASICGLGQTAANAVASAVENLGVFA
jgi:NADH-quinone oxidoreductase subunit F